jgi:hypothetical protein
MKKLLKIVLPIIEIAYLPIFILGAVMLKFYRKKGPMRLKLSTKLLKYIGVFPILDNYYEPQFNDKFITHDLSLPRKLPGIKFNLPNQLLLLNKLIYQKEFESFVNEEKNSISKFSFKLLNGSFESGDAEFLYNFIRFSKPKKVIEIGCGESTKIINKALTKNKSESSENFKHICIEPYEHPWLENFKEIELIRKKVEKIDLKFFQDLEDGDLLFIDSSHIIRPQGDVLYEYLSIIPSLPKGIFIHIHDIFSPHNYKEEWIKNRILFWNEQYLLEALLSKSSSFEVVASLNLLIKNNYDELKKVCPYITKDSEPGSFYFRTI